MKRIALLTLLLASIALAGCQTIKSINPFRHKEPAYKAAQQERPLEVPPGIDQPPTTEALAIPDAGTGAASAPAGVPAMQPEGGAATPGSATASSLNLSDTPANAYHRVGLALQRGGVGDVTAHDDNAHTYQIAIDTVVKHKAEGGFFHRLFHRNKSETVKGTVTVSVAPHDSGSVVQASGSAEAVARVMAVLQQRLQ